MADSPFASLTTPNFIAGPATTTQLTGTGFNQGQNIADSRTVNNESYYGLGEKYAQNLLGVATGSMSDLGQGNPLGPEYLATLQRQNGLAKNNPVAEDSAALVARLKELAGTGATDAAGLRGLAGQNTDQDQAAIRGVANQAPSDIPGLLKAGVTADQWDELSDTGRAKYMNPYQQAVVDTTTDELDLKAAQNKAALTAQKAKTKSFGSRGDVAAALQDRDANMLRAKTVADLMSKGYTEAQATFKADADRKLQADTVTGQQRNAAGQLINQENQTKIAASTAAGNLANQDKVTNISALNSAGQLEVANKNASTAAASAAGQIGQGALKAETEANSATAAIARIEGEMKIARQNGDTARLATLTQILANLPKQKVTDNSSITSSAASQTNTTDATKNTEIPGLTAEQKAALAALNGTKPTTPGGTTPGGTTGGTGTGAGAGAGGTGGGGKWEELGAADQASLADMFGNAAASDTAAKAAETKASQSGATSQDIEQARYLREKADRERKAAEDAAREKGVTVPGNIRNPTTPGGTTPTTPGGTTPTKPSGLPASAVYDQQTKQWHDPATGERWGEDGAVKQPARAPGVPSTAVWDDEKKRWTVPGTNGGKPEYYNPDGTKVPAQPSGVPDGSNFDPATKTWTDKDGNRYGESGMPTGIAPTAPGKLPTTPKTVTLSKPTAGTPQTYTFATDGSISASWTEPRFWGATWYLSATPDGTISLRGGGDGMEGGWSSVYDPATGMMKYTSFRYNPRTSETTMRALTDEQKGLLAGFASNASTIRTAGYIDPTRPATGGGAWQGGHITPKRLPKAPISLQEDDEDDFAVGPVGYATGGLVMPSVALDMPSLGSDVPAYSPAFNPKQLLTGRAVMPESLIEEDDPMGIPDGAASKGSILKADMMGMTPASMDIIDDIDAPTISMAKAAGRPDEAISADDLEGMTLEQLTAKSAGLAAKNKAAKAELDDMDEPHIANAKYLLPDRQMVMGRSIGELEGLRGKVPEWTFKDPVTKEQNFVASYLQGLGANPYLGALGKGLAAKNATDRDNAMLDFKLMTEGFKTRTGLEESIVDAAKTSGDLATSTLTAGKTKGELTEAQRLRDERMKAAEEGRAQDRIRKEDEFNQGTKRFLKDSNITGEQNAKEVSSFFSGIEAAQRARPTLDALEKKLATASPEVLSQFQNTPAAELISTGNKLLGTNVFSTETAKEIASMATTLSLEYAAQNMRGQGSITDNERQMIRSVAAGGGTIADMMRVIDISRRAADEGEWLKSRYEALNAEKRAAWEAKNPGRAFPTSEIPGFKAWATKERQAIYRDMGGEQMRPFLKLDEQKAALAEKGITDLGAWGRQMAAKIANDPEARLKFDRTFGGGSAAALIRDPSAMGSAAKRSGPAAPKAKPTPPASLQEEGSVPASPSPRPTGPAPVKQKTAAVAPPPSLLEEDDVSVA